MFRDATPTRLTPYQIHASQTGVGALSDDQNRADPGKRFKLLVVCAFAEGAAPDLYSIGYAVKSGRKLMTTHPSRTLASFVALMSVLLPAARAATDTGAVEREITRLEQVWNDAYGANELPKYFSYYAENPILVFYNKRTTLADYRKEWTEATKTEPLESAKISDLKIQIDPSGNAAIASYQLDVRTRHAGGKTTLEHSFETDVWFKQKNEWRVCAVHYSTATAN
jgi:ketosteroid isomerase-like protein